MPSNHTMPAVIIKTMGPYDMFVLDTIIFLNTKLLSLQILFGCGGNILNLIVLLSRAMRSRTNLIFAAMAFADLFFLILHIPAVLFFAGVLRTAAWYRNGFSQVIAAMLNWTSAASIWCMMYATIERLHVFRSPFRTSKRSASARFFAVLFTIILSCFLLTVVHIVPPKERQGQKYARYLVLTHMVLVIGLPMVLCLLFNILLVCALRRHSMPLRMLNDSHIHQSLIVQRSRTERKVTIMVTVVLTAFVVCNAPGAIVFALKENDEHYDEKRYNILIQAICNSLTVTGKVLNFLLFCLSSEHFRALLKKRLCYIFRIHNKARPHNLSTTATKTFSVPLNDL